MNRLILPLLLALSAVAPAAELPEDVRKATETHDREVSKLKLAYAQKLDQLLVKYRTAGDTATAKAIEGLIAEVEGKAPGKTGTVNSALAPIIGTWKRDIDGAIWRFAADGTGSFNKKGKLSVSYDAEKDRFVSVADRSVDYFTVTKNPDVLNGTFEKDGRNLRYKLERIK